MSTWLHLPRLDSWEGTGNQLCSWCTLEGPKALPARGAGLCIAAPENPQGGLAPGSGLRNQTRQPHRLRLAGSLPVR